MQEYLSLAGIEHKNSAGHSLRSGFMQLLQRHLVQMNERINVAMTGHETTQMVRRYMLEKQISLRIMH